MEEVKIEKLIKGVATGNYVRELGSKFGSIWTFDGLMVAEATPEQYAAFGATSKIGLGHGSPINWMGSDWSTILAYRQGELAQVNIVTPVNSEALSSVCAFLESLLGKGKTIELPQDSPQLILREIVWQCRDGIITVTVTNAFLQVSVGKYTGLRSFLEKVLKTFGLR
jgi:hypothetical protein